MLTLPACARSFIAQMARPALLKCRVVYALFDEVEDLSQDAAHIQVRDTALLAEAQRIVHYQIATYGALRRFARILEHEEDLTLPEQTFCEEEVASQELGAIPLVCC
jgi:ferritin-like metal-binding protein YciE